MQLSSDDLSKVISVPGKTAPGTTEKPLPGTTQPASREDEKVAPASSPPPPAETLFAAVENLNQALELQQRSVRLRASEYASTAVIEVVDQETDTVIRQIPSESTVKLAEYWSQNGLLAEESLTSISLDETA
ncbi:MAG: flagellar protein FlaG [Lysobacterales bacterium]